MRQKRSLTKRQFDQALARTALGSRSAEMAREVLVGGASASSVADKYQVTPSAVGQHVRAVWQAHTESSELPQGYTRITAVVTEEQAAIVRSWERDAKIKRITL